MNSRRLLAAEILLIPTLLAVTLLAQEPPSPLLEKEWESVAQAVIGGGIIDAQRLFEAPRDQQVPLLERGLTSDSRRLRGYCYTNLIGIARREGDSALARRATHSVLRALTREPDEAELGDAAQSLARLPKAAFDPQSLTLIENLFLNGPDRNELCLLAGLVDTPAVRTRLRKMREGADRQTLWYAGMALARLGEPGMAKKSMDALVASGEEKTLRYLDLCLYVRRPEVLPVLLTYLYRDGGPKGGGDYFPDPYAVSALRVLNEIVRGLPNPGKYVLRPEDIEAARQWFRDHPNPEVIP